MKIDFVKTVAALLTIILMQSVSIAQESLFDSIQRAEEAAPRVPQAETRPRIQAPHEVQEEVNRRMTQPRMTQPRTVQPQPRLAQPRMQSRMTQPRMTQPRMTQPRDAVVPYVNQPSIDERAMGAPQALVSPHFGGGGQEGVSPYVVPRVMPVLPPTSGFLPKLGFQGRLIPGVGMQVISVNCGGIAEREGLETGDIIVEINGRRLMYEYDYEHALVDAAVYGYGRVSLLVQNVRYHPGCRINPPFVRINSQLPMRVAYPTGVVAAR